MQKMLGRIKEIYYGLGRKDGDEDLYCGLFITIQLEGTEVRYGKIASIVKSSKEFEEESIPANLAILKERAEIFALALEMLEKAKVEHINQLQNKFIVGNVADNKLYSIKFSVDGENDEVLL